MQAILLRYGFDILIDQKDIQEARRILHDKFRIQVGDSGDRTLPERVRLMLEELGPTYIKLGQILSSRTDLFGPEWIDEFSRLHDAVPPFSFEHVQKIIERDLASPLDEIFIEFDPEPVAAASLGQVHRAMLRDMQPVVVKVQRPDIQSQIQSDIEIIRLVAQQIESRTSWGKRFGITAIIEEFAVTLNQELDYRNEATNADRLRRNMTNFGRVHVPLVYWNYVTEHVLTMEAIQGFKITDLAAFDAAGIDKTAVADTLVRSIFQQLLIDGFYHADPHPGNLLIDPETGKLNYIDLGMMGRLLPEQCQILGELVNALMNRDSLEISHLLLSIGKTWQPTNETRLRRTIDHLLHRYLEATLEQISFSHLLSEILTTIYKNGVQLPSEYVLAIKALIQGEDVALKLDPQLAIIDIGKAISNQYLWQRYNPQALFSGETMRLARSLPRVIEVLLRQIENGALRIGLDIPDFSKNINHAYIISNRLTASVIVTGMLIGSSIAMNVSPTESWFLIPILGIIGFILSMTVGIMLVWSVFFDLLRSRRRK